MNKYTLICRLRGPAYVLLTGVIALMAEWTSIGWGKSWPLYIVLEGVFQLAQRWALTQSYPPADQPFTGAPGSYPGTYPGAYSGAPGTYPTSGSYPTPAAAPTTSTAIVPAGGPTELQTPPSSEWRS